MAGSAPVSPWPGYPEIPIFLDTGNGYQSSKSQRSSATTFDTSSSISPISPLHAPHCITVTPPKGPPSTTLQIPSNPPAQEYAQRSPQTTERSPVRHLSPVEYPSVNKQSESWSTRSQQHRTPPFRGPPSVSQFRFGDFPSTHKPGSTPLNPGSSTPSGLGIINGPNPIPPPAYGSQQYEEKSGNPPNIAQRIEDRLWHYSMHGNTFKKWLLEIISWSISAGCMAVILVVLVLLKDRPLSKWSLGSTISLNTFVATFSRIASAALLIPVSEALGQLKWSWFFQGTSKKMWDFEIFDNASRGPWGSLQLLVRTKGRKLAALGAAIVLLSLALDPFFQQVVETPERWREVGTGSIPRVIRYSPIFNRMFVGDKPQSFTNEELKDIATDFFFANGTEPIVLGNGTRAEIPVVCPTGNCTWPKYETLGVCSSCHDISSLLEFRCITTRVDWLSTLNSTFDESIYPNGTVCGHFLKIKNQTSDMPILMSGYLAGSDPKSGTEALVMRALPLLTVPMREPLFGGSIHFMNHRNPLSDFLIAAASDYTSVYRNETPVALECVVDWCVKTIQSSYFAGQYEEEIINTFVNTTTGPQPWSTKRIDGGTMTNYLQNITVNPSDSRQDTSAYGSNETNYGITSDTAFPTLLIFDDFLPSFITVANTTSPTVLRGSSQFRGFPRTRILKTNPWTPANNITRHMERFATAWTNKIRSTADGKGVPGKAFIRERFIDVRWEWLSLPLGLLVFSFIFLVATVARTTSEQDHVGVWKTSAIATLLYGLPDAMQKKITSSTSGGTPRAQARELKVKLLPKMGWRISGHVFSPLAPKPRPPPPPPGWI